MYFISLYFLLFLSLIGLLQQHSELLILQLASQLKCAHRQALDGLMDFVDGLQRIVWQYVLDICTCGVAPPAPPPAPNGSMR